MTFNDLLVKLSWATIVAFWPVWIVTTGLALWFAIRSQPKWGSGAALGLVDRAAVTTLLLLVPYVAFLMWGADFVYHDNDVFTENSVIGHPYPLGIWPSVGRYFPLFAQEFDVLGAISPTPTCYYSAVSLQLLAFCLLILLLLRPLPAPFRVGVVVLLILSNSVGIVFADLIYTERNVVFWLAVLLVAMQRYDQSPSRLNLAAALVAAQLTLYYKETAFIFVGSMSVVRLLIQQRKQGSLSWRSLKGQPLELGLLGLTAIFAGQLLVCLAGSRSSQYVRDASVGPALALIDYLRSDPLLLAFAGGIALRAARVRRVAELDPIWDAMAVAALAYFGALVAAGLSADRYVAPVDMVALLFAGRQVAQANDWSSGRRWALGAVASALAFASVLCGATRLFEYKSIVRGTTKLADFVLDYAARTPGDVRLYFPVSPGWRMLNFQVYLKYRSAAASARVHFVAPGEFPEGKCVWYYDFKCLSEAQPKPGDLLVQLPDDARWVSTNPLFAYSLWPGGMPPAAGLLLHREDPLYAGKTMPAGWLRATADLVAQN